MTMSRSGPVEPELIRRLPTPDLALRLLDRVIVDPAEVMDSWRSVRALAPSPVAQGADGVLTSLAGLLTDVEPGWYRPGARRKARQRSKEATTRFGVALAEFDRLTTADAAPRPEERQAAERRSGGWSTIDTQM